MFRISNNLIGLLNFLTFLLSIPILAGGIWLSACNTTDCDTFLDRPIIAINIFLMVISLAGLAGACSRVSCLLWLYLLVMFLLIVLLFCFTIFAFVVTHKGIGEIIYGRGYREYRLGNYSNWLQKSINDSEKGSKIKSCLADSNVCKKFGASNDAKTEFYQRSLSPIQHLNRFGAYSDLSLNGCFEAVQSSGSSTTHKNSIFLGIGAFTIRCDCGIFVMAFADCNP